jgi:hypothetical protein
MMITPCIIVIQFNQTEGGIHVIKSKKFVPQISHKSPTSLLNYLMRLSFCGRNFGLFNILKFGM